MKYFTKKEFAEELRAFRESRNLSQAAFSKRIGMAISSYQNLESGKTTRIEVETLRALAREGMEVVSALGLERRPQKGSPAPHSPTDLPPDKTDDYVLIPRYEVTASAGHGALVTDERIIDWISFKRSWIMGEMGLHPAHLALVAVSGDSMEPTLHSGDLVLVDTASRRVRGGGLYLVRLGDDLMAKRVVRTGPDEIKIVSDNDRWYPPITARISDGAEVIGEIVWFCRTLR